MLPFQNMSGDPEQEYFVDDLVEEIITGLSHSKALFVITRNSWFTYKGQRSTCARLGANSACAMFWKEACARRATVSASPVSSSKRQMVYTCGPIASTATWRTSSNCRIRSRHR